MNLQYDTEQIILRDTAESFLRQHYGYDTYRRVVASDEGWSPELWREFAQLGWLGLPFAMEDGGIGGGAVEAAILMEAFGRFLVIEPYLPTVLLAGGLIAALGSTAERKALLDASERRTDPARLCVRGSGDLDHCKVRFPRISCSAAPSLSSSAHPWPTLCWFRRALGQVQAIIASAYLLSLGNMPGVAARPFRTVDGRRAADIELTSVALPASALLGGNENAGAIIDRVTDNAIAALSADAVGAIAAMVSATVDYAKTRVQFGQPLAKFQALQHRMVRMRVNEEEARASALFATLSLEGPPERRARAISGAKAKIGRCARFVHQNAIQLHGAIGTTNELSLGAYAKRLFAYEALFGATREHLRRYGSLISNAGNRGRRAAGSDRPKGTAMDFDLSPQDRAFRDEVRRFLDRTVPPAMRRAQDLTTCFIVDPDITIHFHRALARKGWSVPNWPVEYGGTGWTPVQRYIFEIECARAGATPYNGAAPVRRAGDHAVRHAAAEGHLPSTHPLGRRSLGAGLFRTGVRV